MAPEPIPIFVRRIAASTADVTKGNRFFNLDDVQLMPAARSVGNAILSFLTELSSGYWDIFDPTNMWRIASGEQVDPRRALGQSCCGSPKTLDDENDRRIMVSPEMRRH